MIKSVLRCAAANFGCAVLSVSAASAAEELRVHFIDVGQADATLIECPDGVSFSLIDAGDTRYPGSSAALRTYLDRVVGTSPSRGLGVVVASHPHADHIGSMQWVLERFDVDIYVDNGEKYDSASWQRLEAVRRAQVRRGEIDYVNARREAPIELSPCGTADVTMTVMSAWSVEELGDTNDRSVLVRLVHGTVTFLFVGDLEAHGEKAAEDHFSEEEVRLLDADVLKVGHHGSDTSSSVGLLQLVSPRAVVVSVGHPHAGTNVRYRHPRSSTIRRLARLLREQGADVLPKTMAVPAFDGSEWRREVRPLGLWATSVDGDIVFVSDGQAVRSLRSGDD